MGGRKRGSPTEVVTCQTQKSCELALQSETGKDGIDGIV
jgi:hypothetical protein